MMLSFYRILQGTALQYPQYLRCKQWCKKHGQCVWGDANTPWGLNMNCKLLFGGLSRKKCRMRSLQSGLMCERMCVLKAFSAT